MSQRVFAYGSNMCSGRFRDYGVTPEGGGLSAVLEGYRLVFNKQSQDGSGKANIEPAAESRLWGVAYTIPDADLVSLDRGEGAGYRRSEIRVRSTESTEYSAWVYIAARPSADPNLRPYAWYKRFLVEGAREHVLPPDYVAGLERIEAIDDEDVQRDREKRALGCPA